MHLHTEQYFEIIFMLQMYFAIFGLSRLPRTDNLQQVEDYQSEVAHDN